MATIPSIGCGLLGLLESLHYVEESFMGSTGYAGRPVSARLRAQRFSVNGQLVVKSKTIGSSLTYNLTTENLSMSGMLLAWNHKSRVPFIENTILEMTIDPSQSWLDRPVTCLGKVVRREGRSGGARFGIQIVQIDYTDLHNWESCILSIETKAKQFLASGPQDLLKDPSSGGKRSA